MNLQRISLSAMPDAQVSREEVRLLALSVGLREAARRLGLKESRVLQWSKRGQWFKPTPQPPKQGDVITVIRPSESLRNLIREDSDATKTAVLRAARKGAEFLADASATAVIKSSRALKDLTSVGSTAGGWDQEQQGSGSFGGLRVHSQQTIINVDARASHE